MAVNYDNTIKVARQTATRDAVADGTLEIGTTGMAAVLATFGLSATGGTIAGAGVWTLAFDATTVVASGTGSAAAAQIKNSGGTARITGLTVGTSGTDVIISNTSIVAGQNVVAGTCTITHAA